MNADEIRTALENARGTPQQALREAVAHAAELAPSVIAVAQRMVDGCLPLPHEERLLRYGLHALAAARETSACPVFLALLRRPPLELEWLFGEDHVITVCQLLLSLFDGDDAAVCALAADVDAGEQVRSGLLTALARLVWQGSASRRKSARSARSPRPRSAGAARQFRMVRLAGRHHAARPHRLDRARAARLDRPVAAVSTSTTSIARTGSNAPARPLPIRTIRSASPTTPLCPSTIRQSPRIGPPLWTAGQAKPRAQTNSTGSTSRCSVRCRRTTCPWKRPMAS